MDWLIVRVDTAGTGYFKVNAKNRILLRMDKTWGGGDLYALNGNPDCMKIPKIKNRMKGVCWLRTNCYLLETVGSNCDTLGARTTDVNALFWTNLLRGLEYEAFMRRFLEESRGKVILSNDTLVFDMVIDRKGKEVPFRIKCVRDSVQ
jgi:hypothetical protein